LFDLDTNQTIDLINMPGSFQQSLSLNAGNYSLIGVVKASASFDFSAFQGTLSDSTGPYTNQLNYTAVFTPPSSTPEPSTFGLAFASAMGVGLQAKRRRKLN
jgi:hypothetical protein